MEASVVRAWSEPSMVTLAVLLKCWFSYENLHTSVVRSVVRLFKSQGIMKMWVSCFSSFLWCVFGALRCPFHVDES